MTPDASGDPDIATWRNRFILLNLTRIGGTLIVFLGLFIWHSDWLRPGGSIAGLPLALLGLAISFGGPKYLSRRWRSPPPPPRGG
jgi:hypothetical protein